MRIFVYFALKEKTKKLLIEHFSQASKTSSKNPWHASVVLSPSKTKFKSEISRILKNRTAETLHILRGFEQLSSSIGRRVMAESRPSTSGREI